MRSEQSKPRRPGLNSSGPGRSPRCRFDPPEPTKLLGVELNMIAQSPANGNTPEEGHPLDNIHDPEENSWITDEEDDVERDQSIGESHLTPHSCTEVADNPHHVVVRPLASSSSSNETARDSKAVHAGKLLVLLVLICSAAGLGVATYHFVQNQDLNRFAAAFQESGKQVLNSAESKVIQTVILMTSVATAMTSFAMYDNYTFPFVTIPDFEIRTRSIAQIAGSAFIGWSPIVTDANKEAWETYCVQNQGWLRQGLDAQGLFNVDPGPIPAEINTTDEDKPYYQPAWQYAPAPTTTESINIDLMDWPWYQTLRADVVQHRHAVLSSANIPPFPEPFTDLLLPIMSNFSDRAEIVGFLTSLIRFGNFFADAVPTTTGRMLLETSDACGLNSTYAIDGPSATYLGPGRLHDDKYEKYRLEVRFARLQQFAPPGFDPGNSTFPLCEHTIAIYPSAEFQSKYESSNPMIYTTVVICVFIFTALVFVLYDWLVRLRQARVSQKAARTTAIVASLFPKNVQDRILEEVENQQQDTISAKRSVFGLAPKAELKQMLGSSKTSVSDGSLPPQMGRPIADLFTDTTVMFADICSFTAWSSAREPSQVFTLLETIYQAFDEIADRRRVFKVETVGDCYVAVAGLPDPRPDHAVVMARFANDCLNRFSKLTKRMEVILGPDTADLGIRIGMHSGPVTAGVLRGQRARFQLFGDTVNTTARMESTGKRNRIQISQETAQLLTAAGKGYWCHQREEKITAKGKGEMQTYWLKLRASATATASLSTLGSSSHSEDTDRVLSKEPTQSTFAVDKFDTLLQAKSTQEKQARLVDWNKEILATKLKVLVAFRRAHGVEQASDNDLRQAEVVIVNRRAPVINEVEEILWLPDYQFTDKDIDIKQVDLGQNVGAQLRLYIQTLATMYRVNPFHNFEHASHVTMSVNKLFSRIIAPELDQNIQGDVYSALHDHTYGITSDPLTQFAVHLAALIHDVDHPGVSNIQLIKERAPMAVAYNDQSVAEQNSVDIAWNLLMEDCYVDLRNTIYATVDELHRFRKLVVNTVMATDIMDKDLKSLRNARWEKAFADHDSDADPSTSSTLIDKSLCRNRKATIVIEHLIQASDVAHTMQHWHVYRKWNGRFFLEMYKAYLDGRAESDPSLRWYEGELGFFDYYVIPLASKLKECGVFGVSSEEYLSYAKQNRDEWESKGRDLVSELMEEAQQLVH